MGNCGNLVWVIGNLVSVTVVLVLPSDFPMAKLQALVYDILLEEGAGKRCSECAGWQASSSMASRLPNISTGLVLTGNIGILPDKI